MLFAQSDLLYSTKQRIDDFALLGSIFAVQNAVCAIQFAIYDAKQLIDDFALLGSIFAVQNAVCAINLLYSTKQHIK
jgi:hypothetical protein